MTLRTHCNAAEGKQFPRQIVKLEKVSEITEVAQDSSNKKQVWKACEMGGDKASPLELDLRMWWKTRRCPDHDAQATRKTFDEKTNHNRQGKEQQQVMSKWVAKHVARW